jgi:hypothetical protein
MTRRAGNIFIIGDLVVDHTVFVRKADRPHHTGVVHEVVRRLEHLPKEQRPQNAHASDIVKGFYEFYAAR